ncbi:hypothetical protein EDB85DRAFT_1887108 [Lactarius pseudohatsudake]|nr:hypothetical protein EDB85DRAFT_1887108 [Lactarius pseudohatsudake]
MQFAETSKVAVDEVDAYVLLSKGVPECSTLEDTGGGAALNPTVAPELASQSGNRTAWTSHSATLSHCCQLGAGQCPHLGAVVPMGVYWTGDTFPLKAPVTCAVTTHQAELVIRCGIYTVKVYGELPENAKINETDTSGECTFEFGEDGEVDIDNI